MLKRYQASKDTTITNAFKANLQTRGTASNMGESDILEVFSIYGQASSGSQEESRVLIQFPILTDLKQDIQNNIVPATASYFLKLFNAEHAETLPTKFTLNTHPVITEWEEGYGLDMSEYSDLGAANWQSGSTNVAWTANGGDYSTGSYFSFYFDKGYEDMELDITSLVSSSLAQNSDNGFLIKLTDSELSQQYSYYTKEILCKRFRILL
jgi:hypothetical protein